MTNPFRRLRPSSPLSGATSADLFMLRTLAAAVQRWETAARNDRYYYLPLAHQLLHNDGGLHQASVLQEFQDRAWTRLSRLPNWESICEEDRVARLRWHDPQAYEVHQLREELAAHKASCR
ncbi:hypothetical protein HTS88_21000 [Pseudarthrobacter oxydans]|uniref:hypothetical protein n=1 Tax=Pseudarthrobacter oxydans TaxID=1671 RepID=UPI00157401E4|nr:hypothetical protein [Pseudarthrobacter oxydans]NSX38860.1 hypothetical protein [Pseudarthrobacter oxydans]